MFINASRAIPATGKNRTAIILVLLTKGTYDNRLRRKTKEKSSCCMVSHHNISYIARFS
jgi:hypothetical protein